MGTLTRTRLSIDVSDVLEIPRRYRKGDVYKIIQAVFSTMTDALQRGETIYIKGLGIFRVRTRKPVKKYVRFNLGTGKPVHTELWELPAKRYVHFIPCGSIVEALNND